jgi:hypothetical protein
MDHWADNDPEPTKIRSYEVSIRVPGGNGMITITVEAVSWERAHDAAMTLLQRNAKVYSCIARSK